MPALMKYETREVRIIRIRIAKIQMIRVPAMIGIEGQGEGEEGDQGDAGHAVGLEAVGRRPDAVARVVARAVGDDARVLRVVLRQMEDDLHQVGADIGDLGEDAAADPAGRLRRAIRRWRSR